MKRREYYEPKNKKKYHVVMSDKAYKIYTYITYKYPNNRNKYRRVIEENHRPSVWFPYCNTMRYAAYGFDRKCDALDKCQIIREVIASKIGKRLNDIDVAVI